MNVLGCPLWSGPGTYSVKSTNPQRTYFDLTMSNMDYGGRPSSWILQTHIYHTFSASGTHDDEAAYQINKIRQGLSY